MKIDFPYEWRLATHQLYKEIHFPRTLSDISFLNYDYRLSSSFRQFGCSGWFHFNNSRVIVANRMGWVHPGAEIPYTWLSGCCWYISNDRSKTKHPASSWGTPDEATEFYPLSTLIIFLIQTHRIKFRTSKFIPSKESIADYKLCQFDA